MRSLFKLTGYVWYIKLFIDSGIPVMRYDSATNIKHFATYNDLTEGLHYVLVCIYVV